MTIAKIAEEHARDAHKDDVDLAGRPYEEHLETVVKLVKHYTNDEETIAIAWLHDVIEDTTDTVSDLKIQGYPESVIDGVLQLTREKGYPYKEYISEITSPKAKLVKICDLLHNQDDRRLPSERKNTERRYKYHRALTTLIGDSKEASQRLNEYYQIIN